MGKFRLAMVAVINSSDGPWTTPKGNETGADVSELTIGEEVWLDRENLDSIRLSSGFTPIEFWSTRFRFRKITTDHCRPSPTTVRVSLNGRSSNVTASS